MQKIQQDYQCVLFSVTDKNDFVCPLHRLNSIVRDKDCTDVVFTNIGTHMAFNFLFVLKIELIKGSSSKSNSGSSASARAINDVAADRQIALLILLRRYFPHLNPLIQ
ncbi:MAG: hypothetical protein IPG07_21700 [Crocinitomicaceae bacterium]|nr:hypothetical protein [Crocinitomicaceae bacterium]